MEKDLGKSIPKKTRKINAALQANVDRVKRGEGLPGAGRPKGSRNKFSETFVQDFIAHWEKHGEAALDKCFEEEIGVYMNCATRIMPKDFNINVTEEANLERLLGKFSSEQLRDLAVGLAALGASSRQTVIEGTAREVPDGVH